MAYKKRSTSDAYGRLSYRLEALRTINPTFDMGNGLSVEEVEELAGRLRSQLNQYNETLSDADDLRSTLLTLERKANDVSQRLLSAALGTYGQDSYEYRRVGGTRKSEIIPTGSEPRTFQPEDANGSATGGSAPDSGGDITP